MSEFEHEDDEPEVEPEVEAAPPAAPPRSTEGAVVYDDKDTVREFGSAASDTGAGDHPRREDGTEAQDDTPTSSEEVDPEAARIDETTVLATDRFNLEGERIN